MDGITWIGSPNHYNGRAGHKVTHITLHIMAGFLTGTDSVFSRSSSQASAHYGIGANGEIHQYVDEANGSWSDANYVSNMTTISIEHEGGIAQAKCTQACIDASARLCADISRRYGFGRLWHDGTKGNVWLHREIAGTDHVTCPDLAPNGLPFQQVIDKANQLLEGDDETMPTAKEIAEAVWNFDQNGVKCRDRLQGIDNAANDINNNVGIKVWSFPTGETQARDRLQGIDAIQLPQLATQVAALTAAVKALSEAMGANPDAIAKTVQDAVKAKLDSLKITVTDKQ